MRERTRHPRSVAAACLVYGLVIWAYPSEFRRAFGHELAVTFRNRVEDVLDSGGILDWFAFAVHIVVDWIRTCSTVKIQADTHGSVSLLGLSEGDAPTGCIDRTTVDVSLVFAVAGLVLGCVGWYTYFAILPSYVH
jgi:hypothetical protein